MNLSNNKIKNSISFTYYKKPIKKLNQNKKGFFLISDKKNTKKINEIIKIPLYNIKKIYIFTSPYTKIFANNLKHYLDTLNIDTIIYDIHITDTIIHNCINDPSLYLLFICPQKILENYYGVLPKNKYILYQTEQYNQYNIPKISENILVNALCIFDYSTYNLNYYNPLIKNKIKILSPLINTKIIYSNFEKDIDILFIGTLNPRRKNIINKMREYIENNNLNYNFINVENVFGEKLDNIIKRSKCVVNLHYFNNSLFEIFRIHDLLNYDCIIISEPPQVKEEQHLIFKYNKVIKFFPTINDNLKNIYFMFNLLNTSLKSKIDISEREKFIKENNNISHISLTRNLLCKNLFHKYILEISKPSDKIDYNISLDYQKQIFIKSKYYAHLHCYNISEFYKIYGDYIDKINEYCSIIVTYSISNIPINLNNFIRNNFVILKIPNKGMDIGAKFCAVAYLNSNKIPYDYILFLHSKSNPETRRKYFEPLINNLSDRFIENINQNDAYFPDIEWEIVGDRLKTISGNPEYINMNLPERNLLYRNEILKYLGATNDTNRFIEGNCYILSKRVIDKLYTDPNLYNILNTETSFDYNWISKVYNIEGDIYEVYKQFLERKLAPRNRNSYDGYIEHVFERVVLNFCDNYKILKETKNIEKTITEDNEINLIGLKNINVSIKDNLFLLKNYFNRLNNNTKINIYDISEIKKINFNVNTIFCIQPFEISNLLSFLSNFKNKPEVLWVWEFKSLPQIFKDYEKYFSKVYVPSQFCYDVFSKHLSIPVEKIELKSMIHEYIYMIPNHIINNSRINNILENIKDKTIYGFCFDLNSSIVRKNPLNLVRAFNNLNDETKVLILKYRPPRGNKFINKIENDIYNSFITEVKKNKNIYCITDELEPLDLYKLYTNFHYYISPHCGEGFGITIYDNMVLGNKIISPYYSGETEYLNREDILELDYEEKEITGLREHPVYGQMKDFKGAYISVESIEKCLINVIGDEIYILGNGPSLKNYDFNFLKRKTTFALNSSYKKFAELDFYPTYFGCFDPKLIECHYDKFVQLMNENNKIKKFFFLNENNKGKNQFSFQDENNSRYQKINFLPPQESYINKSSFNKFYKMHNSGATATLISILLGYKKIILLGCDGNYLEQLPETRLIDASTKTLQILETPEKNPNYWFDNYQEKGEIYSVPDGNSCHMKGWELLYQASKIHNVEIINENPESKIPYFVKMHSNNIKGKVIYKIISKQREQIIINNEANIDLKQNDIFTIYYHNNYKLFLNDENIGTENMLNTIHYQNNNEYDLSIILPFSSNKECYESQLNFNYILKEYIRITKDFPNIQLCLTHTEKEYISLIDKIIEGNNINYIFVKNPYNFNLGYNRNLWKYICNSNKIIFNDTDIPLSTKNLIELIETSKNYDLVKPYNKNLIHTDKKEKDLYIKNNIIPNKNPKCLFSITGGVTLFDKKVLLETGGYEEFNGHGYEDRCLDVIILNNGYSIKRLDNKIVHLYHPEISFSGKDFDSINKKFYNCCINKNCKDNIHEKCNHIKDTTTISDFNKKYNGNLCLFRNPYLNSINLKKNCSEFNTNHLLKDFTITLLGYTKISEDGSRHTNWFPWNRFQDVFQTIGYKCEWTTLEKLERKDEKRLFITWNEPTSLEIYQSSKVNKDDIVFQKLTSLGKGMNDVNWTENPKKWCEEWNWPIYKTVEYLYDLGLNIYGFGCKTDINSFSEKKRICEKLKDRIHWISWGGTPFNWEQIKNCKPINDNLNNDINFVGSKWGKVGRGNVDAWKKYIEPFENDNFKYKFNQYGGIGHKMVTDDEMVKILQTSKLCPIIHAPSWQAERGVQDRFYTVFLSGRFGICDNLGAVDIFGDEIKDICTEDPEEYHKKSIYYLEHPEEQLKYIEIIQKKIKERYNFYRQWESIFNSIKLKDTDSNNNIDIITCINYSFLPNKKTKKITYNNENINNFFDKIFIINLKKDITKKINILEILEHYNITNYEFIDAVDGNEIVKQKKFKDIIEGPLSTFWEKKYKRKHIKNNGELGCLLSHLRIIEIAKERGYEKWLHLEDDIILDHNFNNLFKERMKYVPNNWDILYFGTTQCYWRKYNKEIVNNFIYKANISCGTFAFAISNTNIDFILNKFLMLRLTADGTLTQEVQNILNCYVFKENLIVARLNNSSIRKSYKISEEIEQFKRFGWDFEKYNIDRLNINKKIFINDNIKNDFNIIFNNLTNINEFQNYVKNKKIAIIGPSPSIRNEKNGEYIEKNYDIIIRINKQWKHSEKLDEYIGKRTDILYNCLDYREDCGGEIDINYNENKLKFIVSTIKYDFLNKNHRDSQFHGKSFLHWYNYFHLKNRNKIKFIPMDNIFYDYYDILADTRINTGLMAILHILNFDIKELYIKGFSFFLDGYLNDYRHIINGSECVNENESVKKVIDFMVKKNKNHDQEKQWKLFKNIYQENKNKINLDETLKEILKLEKFPHFD